jgi:hypothetical protein
VIDALRGILELRFGGLLERASDRKLVVGASHIDALFRVEMSNDGFRALAP